MASQNNQVEDGPDRHLTNASEQVAAFSPRTLPSQLGFDFQPSNFSVISGKGKALSYHPGNRHLRMLVSTVVQGYNEAGRKLNKSNIVACIVAVIRQGGGAFCKCEKGTWFEVGDYYARKKVSALFRDMLHTRYPCYRSSAKAKTARQRDRANQNATQTQRYYQQLADHGIGHSGVSVVVSSSRSVSSTDSLGFDHSRGVDFFDIDVVFEN
jgi:hypothetical protein